MKFDFNAKFLKSLNEILDTKLKSLESHLQANYAHVDDVLCKEDIEERLNEIETIVEDSEIEYKTNIIDQDDLEEAFQNSDLESRIEDLENEDIHALKILRDDQEKRILTLESENREMKERLLTLENFILKTLKGFKDD